MLYVGTVIPVYAYCINKKCKEYNIITNKSFKRISEEIDYKCYCIECKTVLSIEKENDVKS